jgi:hypothetical protein
MAAMIQYDEAGAVMVAAVTYAAMITPSYQDLWLMYLMRDWRRLCRV